MSWSDLRVFPLVALAAGVLGLPVVRPALAQVSTDQGALDSLGAAPAVKAASADHAAPPARPPRHPPAQNPARHDTAHRASPKAPPARAPVIQAAPPPQAVLPPSEPTVPARPAVPPPVPVVTDAPNELSPIPGGTRVTFGAGRSDLNPASIASLRALAQSLKADAAATVSVDAWSAGTPDDPSTPRRLSLARALAVRAVLISEGLASPRIYVRALGTDPGNAPPDRAEVTRTGASGKATGTAAAPGPPAAPDAAGVPAPSAVPAAPARSVPGATAPDAPGGSKPR